MALLYFFFLSFFFVNLNFIEDLRCENSKQNVIGISVIYSIMINFTFVIFFFFNFILFLNFT